jgi:hypothetical protein
MVKRKLTEDLSRIPICTSDFLQDVSIELGRRMESVRSQRRLARLEFRVNSVEFEGQDVESLDVTCWIEKGSYIQVVVLENGVANYMFCESFQHKHDTARYTGFIATLNGWEACDVANLIRDSLRNDVGIQNLWRKLHDEQKSK